MWLDQLPKDWRFSALHNAHFNTSKFAQARPNQLALTLLACLDVLSSPTCHVTHAQADCRRKLFKLHWPSSRNLL